MLPDKSNNLLTFWQGPFEVIKRISPVNYVIDVRGNHNTFHFKMLKTVHHRRM